MHYNDLVYLEEFLANAIEFGFEGYRLKRAHYEISNILRQARIRKGEGSPCAEFNVDLVEMGLMNSNHG